MHKSIEAIIFDLAGVLYEVDAERSLVQFARLGMDMPLDFEAYHRHPLVNAYEKNEITTQAYFDGLRTQYSTQATDAQLHVACTALLVEMPVQRVAMLQHLAKRYPLFLLSNASDIQIAHINQQMQQQHQCCLDDLFNKVYLSYELGMRKPDPQIFQHVVSMQGLSASTTLFIDDYRPNVEAAESVGLQGLHAPVEQEVCDLLPLLLDEPVNVT